MSEQEKPQSRQPAPKGSPQKAPPLRRRGEAMRQAVFEAVMRLLTERGPQGVTMVGVAAAAGVHESSLYRHFGSREKLLYEAASRYSDGALQQHPISDDVRADLRATLASLVDYLNTPQGAAIVRMATVAVSPEFDRESTAYWHQRLDHSLDIVRNGITTGQLRADTDPKLVVDALIGPVLARSALFRQVMAKPDAMRLVDQVLRGVLA
ncbi:TetR/AcrR family transcriptional regulator [Kitasatospora sp. NPDC096204]|uniref:TetR/AcrR family transcriptional regulator n=1 Tax=Kitasatospora sp. NPDC096204 TaxID=3364094 RepID=UPI0038061D61